MRTARTCAIAALMALAAGPLAAQDFDAPLDARKGQFQILALNLGVLGGMARGISDYDAELAGTAADNIAAVASLDQAFGWPEGSDAMSIDNTRAEPMIWDNRDDFISKWDALAEPAAAMQTAAREGQEALAPAMRDLAAACKACHDDYRVPD